MSHHYHDSIGRFIGIMFILSWIAGLGTWILAYIRYSRSTRPK